MVSRRDLFVLLLVALGQAALPLLVALLLSRCLDLLMEDAALARSSSATLVASGGFAALALLAGALRAVERTLAERCGQEVAHRLRLRLWDHLQFLPSHQVHGERQGAVLLRFLGDLTSMRLWVSRGLVGGAAAGATIVGALLGLLWLDGRIALVTGLCLLCVLIVQMATGPMLRRRQQAVRRARTRLATDVMERVALIGVVQAFGQQRRERRRVSRASDELRERAQKFALCSGVHRGLSDAAALWMTGLVLLVAFLGPADEAPSVGSLAASLVLVRVSGRPVRRLARVQELWQRMVVAEEKLRGFLDLPAELEDAAWSRRLPDGPGTVKFRSVSVYGALEEVSAVAPGGSLVRVEGRNGSGKSTLLEVLAALRRPDDGRAVVDGRDLARCRLATLRTEVGVVHADLPLMRGTLRRNLLYRRPSASPRELEQLIEALELQPLIDRLGGLGARIKEGAANLSAGERQQLAMARAAVGSPRVLILDEPDAHLDRQNRTVLRRFLESYAGTVLLVWHGDDPPRADRVWTLEEGRLRRRRQRGRRRVRLHLATENQGVAS